MTRQNVLRCSIALVGLVVAATAFGAGPTNAPLTSDKPGIAATAPGGLICRTRLRPGSHIAKRTCLTAAQWAARSMRQGGAYAHEGAGPWGQVSTTGASVGMSAFTAR